MKHRVLASVGFLAAAIAVAALAPTPAAGQALKAAPKAAAAKADAKAAARTALRTAWGDPDLQGIWDFATITPMERPTELAGKEVLSDQEAAEFERTTLERRNPDRRDGGAAADVSRAYNQFWWDYGTKVIGTKRTSLVVDPPDGRIPPMTEDGKKRTAAAAAALIRPSAGPEDRYLAERCLLGFNAGPPMFPSAYNNNVQIFQAPGYVVLLIEMVHDARVVALDGRPHLPAHIRQWKGDSRGRWDGNTLVVETTNFRSEANFRGAAGPAYRLLERFKRVDADTLEYQFTADDPNTWTRPWTAAVPMQRTELPIYEYACHEGNYGMFNLLAGARAQEKAAEEAAKKATK